MSGETIADNRSLALLNYLYALAILTVVAGILTAAMALQYGNGEIPCPLCLLQRVAMFGVCFGIIQNLRQPFSHRNTGISLLFAVFLLVVSVRQTLLDIYPRPGHEYIGSAVLGLHMPVWSVLIALALIIAFTVQLLAIGGGETIRRIGLQSFPWLDPLATTVSLYVLAICAINLISVLVQCGTGQCHTTGYVMLK